VQKVKDDPTLGVYFGITRRCLETRIDQHINKKKQFTSYRQELVVPNLHILADLEYHVIAEFVKKVGPRNLLNNAAGGDYYQPEMNVPGQLYVLLSENKISYDKPISTVNFQKRGTVMMRKYQKAQENLDNKAEYFKLTFLNRPLNKMEYEVRPSQVTAAQQRNAPFVCNQCKFTGHMIGGLNLHKRTVHCEKHKCPLCGIEFKGLSNHMRIYHKGECEV